MSLVKKYNNNVVTIANKSIIDHNQLDNRSQYGCHPISAIRNLPEKLTNLKTQAANINLEKSEDNLIFTNSSGTQTTFSVLTTVDNDTIQYADSKLSLKKVYTDSTLTGDGTSSSPLHSTVTSSVDDVTITRDSDDNLRTIGLYDSTAPTTPVTATTLANHFTSVEASITANTNSITTEHNTNTTQTAQILALQNRVAGIGGYLTATNFGVATPAQSDITDYAMHQIFDDVSTHTQTEIFNLTRVKNTFDNHVWILTNTPDSTPAVFEWTDDGLDTVSTATSSTLGVVKGSNADLEVNVDTNGIMTINGLSNEFGAKTDKVTNATSGNLAGLDSNGNLTDSGKKPSDFSVNAIIGTTDPTTSTVGEIGQFYLNTATPQLFQCTAISSGTYTWVQVGGGRQYEHNLTLSGDSNSGSFRITTKFITDSALEITTQNEILALIAKDGAGYIANGCIFHSNKYYPVTNILAFSNNELSVEFFTETGDDFGEITSYDYIVDKVR